MFKTFLSVLNPPAGEILQKARKSVPLFGLFWQGLFGYRSMCYRFGVLFRPLVFRS